jgi:hypothetical protein
MHHLFKLEEAKKGQFDSVNKAQLSLASKNYETAARAFVRDSSVTNQAELVKSLSQLVSAVDTLLVSYTLEEMTIEDILRAEYKGNRLRFVADYGPINGAKYIDSSGAKAAKILKQVSERITVVQAALKPTANFWNEYKLLDDLQAKYVDNRTKEMDRIRGRNLTNDILAIRLSSQDSLAALRAPSHGAGCSHSHAAEELLEQALGAAL